jgi:hypothetical protein
MTGFEAAVPAARRRLRLAGAPGQLGADAGDPTDIRYIYSVQLTTI